MNNSIFWRLLWKEYRAQRALWLAMLLLTVMLQLISLVAWMVLGEASRISVPLFALGLGLPAFYALGCGATLFAAEYEAGTYEFQRMLPVAALRVFCSKLLYAVVSTAVLMGLLWLSASVLAGWKWPDTKTHVGLWALCGFGAVELLVWAVLFSLLSTRPLRAAILAVSAASVSVHFVFVWINVGYTYRAATYLDPASLPYRAAIVGVVLLLDVWLGYRWFRCWEATNYGSENFLRSLRFRGEGSGVRGLLREAWRRVARRSQTAIAADRSIDEAAAAPRRTTILGRLLWQQSRQSIGTMGTLAALAVVLGLVGAWVWNIEPYVRDRYVVVALLAAATASLMGSCVFLADQRASQFRGLAEQGVSPGCVWLSRQIVWMAPALLMTVAVLPLLLCHWMWDVDDHVVRIPHHPDGTHFVPLLGDAREIGFLLGCVAAAYGSGQLCSMFLRSGLLAAIFGLALTSVFCGWVGLMWWWEVNWFWSVAPIPLVLLLATWLRTPDWLLQRNRLSAWLRPGLTVSIPLAALAVAVPIYRIEQVPLVDPGFSPEEYAREITAEEQETVDLYRRAMERYVSLRLDPESPNQGDEPDTPEPATEPDLTAKQIAWIEANQETIALTIEASRRGPCDFFNPTHEDPAWWRSDTLANLLAQSVRKLQSEGKLDEALERYTAVLRFSVHLRHRSDRTWWADRAEESVYDRLPGWAAHPRQTAARVRAAVDRLVELDGRRPLPSDEIKARHVRILRIISADPDALAETDLNQGEFTKATLWARWLPWEQARARRLLNLRTADALEEMAEVEAGGQNSVRDRYLESRRHDREEPLYSLRHEVSLPAVWLGWDDTVERFVRMETRRRAVRLQLLLVAWRIEHGSLPETLDQLVGPHLDRVPIDPWSGEPFEYAPQGLPTSGQWREDWRTPTKHIEAGTPFVWSAGSNLQRTGSDAESPTMHERYDITPRPYDWDRWLPARSDQEIWLWGWIYPVP